MGSQNLQYFDSDFDLENQSRSWFWTKITFNVLILYLKRTRQYEYQYRIRVQGLSTNLKNSQKQNKSQWPNFVISENLLTYLK